MGYFVCILIFATGLVFFPWLLKNSVPRRLVMSGWLIKLVASLAYIYIFTTYYGEGSQIHGDSLKFMHDGRVLREVARENPVEYLKIISGITGSDPKLSNTLLASTNIWDYGNNGDWINDNRLIIRIDSVIYFFSFDNLYVHALIFSFLAYIGLILFFLAFEKYIARKQLFFLAITVLPSVLFWGSGITKETLMLLSMGLLFFGVERLTTQPLSFKNFAALIAGLFLILINKPYVGLVIVPLLTVIPLGSYFQFRKSILWIFSGLIVMVSVLLSYVPEKLNLVDKISTKQKDLVNLAKGGVFFVTDSSFCAFDFRHFENFDTTIGNNRILVNEATSGYYKLFGNDQFYSFTIEPSDKTYETYLVAAPSISYFESVKINNRGINLITSIPEAFFNTLIRPFPTDPGSGLKYFSFIQNMGLLAWFVFVFFNRRKLKPEEQYRFYILVISSLIILLVIAWTTPVFGAITRYKVPADLLLLTASFFTLKKSNG